MFEAYKHAALVCAAQYQAALEAIEAALIAEWRASDHDDFHAIADALASGDYTGLAI